MAKPENEIVRLASEHVFNLFREPEASSVVAFRGFKHSRDVVSAAKEIAKGSDLDSDDARIVLLAAWFVDAAYAVATDGQRRNGVELARDFLVRKRQPEELVDAVTACIEAAPSPSHDQPLHEVLHDALLSPLASKDFIPKAELYRLEQDRLTGKRFSDVEWTERCIAFIESHPYRTRYAQIEFDRGREANLMKLHKRLRKQREAMNVLALDGPTLQKTMVDQLYLGKTTLTQRTRGLRLTYDAFIYGLAFSLAVFAFVLIRR